MTPMLRGFLVLVRKVKSLAGKKWDRTLANPAYEVLITQFKQLVQQRR